MNPHSKHEQIVGRFEDLPLATQTATARFLIGAKISEIHTVHAHGQVETVVTYLRHAKVHQLVYSETAGRLIGASEGPGVEEVLAVMSEAGREAVRAGGGRVRKVKVKRNDLDGAEYVQAHYVDDEGVLSNAKFALDGSPQAPQGKAA
jgi:hypothetical protein